MLSFYGVSLSSSSTFTGHVTYTMTNKKSNPSVDEADAYAKIELAMDSAVWFYNMYTTITKKLTVEYDTSVGTADGSSNGNIRFGKNRQYMKGCTAMHEISHTVGVGTIRQWAKLISNKIYTGASAIKKLREIDGDPKAVLNGDNQHFWPYGLNYDYEVKSKNDLINHCLIVNAMQRDFYPQSILASEEQHAEGQFPIVSKVHGMLTFSIQMPCYVEARIYTLSGQKVAVFGQSTMPAGEHSIRLNSGTLPQGSYICRFQAGRHFESQSFKVIK